MTVTVVTRWTGPADAALKAGRDAKRLWMKNGAKDVRMSQIFTGQFTGQWIVAVSFADMASYAKAQAAVTGSTQMRKIQASLAKVGATLQERELLAGVEL